MASRLSRWKISGWPRLSRLLPLAAGLSLIAMSVSPAVQADPGTGIIISRDGGNVNVTLDPSVIPDVSIKRNEGKMIIHIPKASRAANSGLIVDSALKKGSTVQETETPTGRTITVNSDQVYLITEDLGSRPVSPAQPSPPAASKTAVLQKPALTAKIEPIKTEGSAAKPTSPVPVPKQALVNAANPKSRNDATLSALPDVIQGLRTAGNPAGKNSQNVRSARAEAEQSTIREAIATARAALNRTAEPAIGMESRTDENHPEGNRQNGQAIANTDNLPLPDAAQPGMAISSPDKPVTAPVDPESLPLQEAEPEQQAVLGNSTGLMLRLVLSLMGALALAVVFLKLVLPKLITRYPGFFENLEAQSRQQQEAAWTDGWPRSRQRWFGPRSASAERWPDGFLGSGSEAEPRKNGGFFAPVKSIPDEEKPMPVPDSKNRYLEKLGEKLGPGKDKFQVLTSASLGKGKELHLVEICGRQLVVATTPYTVSLIKDLTGVSEADDSAPIEISGLLANSCPMDEGGPVDSDTIRRWEDETDGYYTQVSSVTRAYLEDRPAERQALKYNPGTISEDGVRPETFGNPYASKPIASAAMPKPREPIGLSSLKEQASAMAPPGLAWQAEPSQAPAQPNPLDHLYRKYLERPEQQPASADMTGEERERAIRQHDAVRQGTSSFLQPSVPRPDTYVDAEEVVILADYDDRYED